MTEEKKYHKPSKLEVAMTNEVPGLVNKAFKFWFAKQMDKGELNGHEDFPHPTSIAACLYITAIRLIEDIYTNDPHEAKKLVDDTLKQLVDEGSRVGPAMSKVEGAGVEFVSRVPEPATSREAAIAAFESMPPVGKKN